MRLLSVTLPYLLLVSFYSGELKNFELEKITAINQSPYYGVAVPLIGAYDTEKYTLDDFFDSAWTIKDSSKKDVWPWVFFNRFIGYKKSENALSQKADQAYFRAIKGMDLYNNSGALNDFYDIWKISLQIAKKLGSPGIVVDPEAYNNYQTYSVSYISKQLGEPEEQVKRRLNEMGRKLTEIADEIYPKAIIWFLFTGLGNPMRTLNSFDEKQYRSVTYIIQGMLEYGKEKGSKLKLVSGGELSLGYCSISLEDLKHKVRSRGNNFFTPLKSYPNLLLGGTMAPWNDAGSKKVGYFTKGTCGKSKLKNLKDFKPLIKNLSESYEYVWIYAAKSVGYDPYSLTCSSVYNRAITESANDNS
jgi:hypothetical protein